jgi:RNA polymerase sigma factor (sigma-70 family)
MVSNRVSRGNTDAVGEAAGGDAVLLDAVRRGDRDAYVELYEHHVGAARALARSLLRNQTDADDVVSEVFASVLSTIKRGKGPRDGFRAYLMASVRNECYRAWRRRGRDSLIETDAEAVVASGQGTVETDPFARRDEVAVLQEAFESLSPRFREVLWHTEVEGRSHEEIAEATGSTAQAVAARAMRARRALGGAYLQRHIMNGAPAATMPPACADTRRQLADLVRDSISTRGRRRLDVHLFSCPSCREARDELEQFNQHLRTAPGLPLAAGAGILRIGLKARVLGALTTSSASLVAAGGLVVVSTVVPLVIAHRASGDDRVAAVAERAVPATTVTAAPADPGVSNRGGPTPDDDAPPTTAAPPPTTARPRPDPNGGPNGGGGDPGGAAPTTSAPAGPGPASPPTATAPPSGSTPPVTTTPTPPITVLPSIGLPPVSTPGVELPGVTTPAVSLPPVSLPVVTVPSVTVPSLSVPSITVPSITVPPVTLPPVTVSRITLPSIGG